MWISGLILSIGLCQCTSQHPLLLGSVVYSLHWVCLRARDKNPESMQALVRLRPGTWILQVLAPPWVNQLSSKRSYYVCHLVPLLCPRWIWDSNLRLWNADTDGWQRLIQLQLGQNKQLFEMNLLVGREGGFLSCCTDRFSFLNEHDSRQVI